MNVTVQRDSLKKMFSNAQVCIKMLEMAKEIQKHYDNKDMDRTNNDIYRQVEELTLANERL
jgi:hypothetical protein